MAKAIQEAFPSIKGFYRRGLYKMKQFYKTYCKNEIETVASATAPGKYDVFLNLVIDSILILKK